jgi:hypothetical protein
MQLIVSVGAILVILAATGCGQTSPSASAPTASAAGTGAATSAPTPSVTGSSATPTASDMPTVPDPSTALDVTKTVRAAGFASFASPSGEIWCAIYGSDALCHFPYDFSGKIPSSTKVCPDENELDVTGVMVDGSGADYFCSGDPEANPQLEDSDSAASTGWWKATGWPSVKLDGQKLATVPYRKAVVSGDYVCASATSGVTCANTSTGKGFRVARAGVAFIG